MNKKVKNLIGVALVLAAVIIPLSLTNGCASITSALSNTNSTAITAIRLAANTGTAYALQHKPEWKPLFQTAHDDLGALLAAGSLDLSQLQTILAQLPVKELKSDTARIIISNAQIIFDDYVKAYTSIDQVAAIRVVGQAIYDGLDKALQ